MTGAAERHVEKHRRRYAKAAAAMAAAVSEASLRAAVHAIQSETGAPSDHAVRASVKAQSLARGGAQ